MRAVLPGRSITWDIQPFGAIGPRPRLGSVSPFERIGRPDLSIRGS
jgi:hypothetical protein